LIRVLGLSGESCGGGGNGESFVSNREATVAAAEKEIQRARLPRFQFRFGRANTGLTRSVPDLVQIANRFERSKILVDK
jgi:hypothetical protein